MKTVCVKTIYNKVVFGEVLTLKQLVPNHHGQIEFKELPGEMLASNNFHAQEAETIEDIAFLDTLAKEIDVQEGICLIHNAFKPVPGYVFLSEVDPTSGQITKDLDSTECEKRYLYQLFAEQIAKESKKPLYEIHCLRNGNFSLMRYDYSTRTYGRIGQSNESIMFKRFCKVCSQALDSV